LLTVIIGASEGMLALGVKADLDDWVVRGATDV
jgi:hypothetical protein